MQQESLDEFRVRAHQAIELGTLGSRPGHSDNLEVCPSEGDCYHQLRGIRRIVDRLSEDLAVLDEVGGGTIPHLV